MQARKPTSIVSSSAARSCSSRAPLGMNPDEDAQVFYPCAPLYPRRNKWGDSPTRGVSVLLEKVRTYFLLNDCLELGILSELSELDILSSTLFESSVLSDSRLDVAVNSSFVVRTSANDSFQISGSCVRLLHVVQSLACCCVVLVKDLLNSCVVACGVAVSFLSCCVVTLLRVQRTESCA